MQPTSLGLKIPSDPDPTSKIAFTGVRSSTGVGALDKLTFSGCFSLSTGVPLLSGSGRVKLLLLPPPMLME
jgi:hypothetical protein